MCAAMPMLRVRSIGYCRFGEFTEVGFPAATGLDFSATASMCDPAYFLTPKRFGADDKNAPGEFNTHRGGLKTILLPAEVSKGFVRLSHLVHFVAFANGVPLTLIGLQNFRGEGDLHGDAF